MACEPIGINYLGQKKLLLKKVIWPFAKLESPFEKITIAIF